MIAFIDDHRGAFGVEPICRVLRIAPSACYAAMDLQQRRVPEHFEEEPYGDLVLVVEPFTGDRAALFLSLHVVDRRPRGQFYAGRLYALGHGPPPRLCIARLFSGSVAERNGGIPALRTP